MSIRFTHGRLHVGYRKKDWSDVWTEPAKNEEGKQDIYMNEEGEPEIMLYRFTLGKAGCKEELMDGEVKWHPLFDDANCESSKRIARHRMQKQFLTDAYKYLAEKDPERVRALEEDLDQPGFSRWQTWFKEAKKFKKTQMRQRDNRRQTRVQQATEAGATEFEIRKQVSSDTSDSAYESDEEERVGTRRSTTHMPPPPRRPNKRKTAKNGVGGWKSGTKKQRLSNISNGSNQHRASSLLMSGGRGNRSASVESSNSRVLGGNISTSEGRIDDEYDESGSDEIMDTRDPNTPLPPPILSNREQWNFDPITPAPTGTQTLDRSPGRSSVRSTGSRNGANNTQNQHNTGLNGLQLDGEEDDIKPEDRAMRHIREQSVLGMNDDDALQAAIRQSQEPQGRREDEQVADSIEEGADDS